MDFPRLQFLVLLVLLIAFQLLLLDLSDPASVGLLAVALLCLVYQSWWIIPYSPLFPCEVKSCRVTDAERSIAIMTANVLARTDTAEPELAPVTFVLTGGVLTTVRYHEPRAFQIVTQRAERNGMPCENAEQVLLALLEAIVDRIADVLEREGALLDRIARSIFRRDGQRRLGKVDLGGVLEEVGLRGELNSKIQESLITMDRIAGFLGQMALAGQRSKTARARVKTLARDARSLADHAGFQAQKITFLLDATLGLVNIEQNGIIKIFSVAAVVFLPPTLVASIYGMNFAYMPELGWRLGYPWALGLMVASAVLPYLFFKRKGWL